MVIIFAIAYAIISIMLLAYIFLGFDKLLMAKKYILAFVFALIGIITFLAIFWVAKGLFGF